MIYLVINIKMNQQFIYSLQILRIGLRFKTAESSRLVKGLSTFYADVRHGAHLTGAYQAHKVGEWLCSFSVSCSDHLSPFPCLIILWSECAFSSEVLFFTIDLCCTRKPQYTEKWNWRNALWEDVDIFSDIQVMWLEHTGWISHSWFWMKKVCSNP